MKAAESKSTVTAPKENKSFFSKDSEASLQQSAENERPYSLSAQGRNRAVQPKLSVGRADDHYEKEADAMADKVVQHLDERPAGKKSESPVLNGQLTPVVQNKSSLPVSEEKFDKKEEERPEKDEVAQRKPIFESRADMPDDDNKVRRKSGEEKEEAIQAKSETTTQSEAPASIETGLNASKGAGQPLETTTRKEMESSFGADFTGVRVHNDSRAIQLSRDLRAQAFTHGGDIYFNTGKYNTTSTEGKHLLAHELTHTLQQGKGVHKMIQKAGGNKGAAATAAKIDSATSTISLPLINMPEVKDRGKNPQLQPPLVYPKGYVRKESYVEVEDESSDKAQREVWKKAVEDPVKKVLTDKTEKAKKKNAYDEKLDTYYFIHSKNKKLPMVGKLDTLVESAMIPTWTKAGKASAFDVDHIRELQLGGKNYHTNMELLNFRYNRSAGNAVKNEIDNKIDAFLGEEKKKGDDYIKDNKIPKSSEEARKNFSISFESVTFKNSPAAKGDDYYWSIDEISGGKQVSDFNNMSANEMKKMKGEKGKEVIYTSPTGGVGITKDELLAFNKKGAHITFQEPVWEDQTGKAPGEKAGSFDVKFAFYGSDQTARSFKIPVYQMEGVLFGGHIPRRGSKGKGGLEQILVGLDMEGLSPISVDTVELVPGTGFQMRGRIKSTLKIIEGLELDFYVDGNDIGISKTLTTENLQGKLPKPFKINSASLTVGAGTNGVFVEGDVLFEIEKIGTGKISGIGKSNGNFGISGHFDFDKKLFKGQSASVDVAYNNKDGWSVKGELKVDDKAVKGIKSGTIMVGYANNVLEASGTAEVKLKGVDEVTLRIKFAEGVSEIEGGVKISKLPGIKDGEGQLKIVKKGDEYDFSGSGKITPDIPGISTQLGFEFHNDIFLVDTRIAFEKGRLKGDLNVGITNRAVGEDGKPTGEALPDYKVYGGGELSLKITDNITVTAGVRLLENGEIEVKGGIKLPPKIEVVPKLFEVKNKPIISIPEISFPLFGIPLGVTTLGLEATIAPYIKADAQVGPGYLANTQAEVTYNPSHPDEMTVTGSADFEFIAQASIHAGVDFGVGISIGIAAASGGINLDAYISVAAKQPIFHADIKYSPATGFELTGNVKAIVAAILGFSGNLFLKLRAGVWPLKKTWRWDKQLFKKEIDTGLEIGFEFPFAYKNGKADISFDNMKFVYPKFDRSFINTLSDKLIKPVVDDLL